MDKISKVKIDNKVYQLKDEEGLNPETDLSQNLVNNNVYGSSNFKKYIISCSMVTLEFTTSDAPNNFIFDKEKKEFRNANQKTDARNSVSTMFVKIISGSFPDVTNGMRETTFSYGYDTEEGCDRVYLKVNGSVWWDGQSGKYNSNRLGYYGTGTTFEIRYEKDGSIDGGEDYVYLRFPKMTGEITVNEVMTQPKFLSTGVNYSEPYIPEYPGSPATKQFVEDEIKNMPAPTMQPPTKGQAIFYNNDQIWGAPAVYYDFGDYIFISYHIQLMGYYKDNYLQLPFECEGRLEGFGYQDFWLNRTEYNPGEHYQRMMERHIDVDGNEIEIGMSMSNPNDDYTESVFISGILLKKQ